MSHPNLPKAAAWDDSRICGIREPICGIREPKIKKSVCFADLLAKLRSLVYPPVCRFGILTLLGEQIMKYKSALLTQASGSINGITFSHNRGGQYIRARAIPTDPGTAPQNFIRGIMASMVNRWETALSAVQRTAWNLYALNTPLLGPLGDPIQVSGINMFVRNNVPRLQVGLAIIPDAPVIFDTGILSPMGINSATAVPNIINLGFNDVDDWNVAGGGLLIYTGRPQNQGISFFKGPFQTVSPVLGSGPGVSPIAVTPAFLIAVDQRVWVRARATYPDGRLTAPQILGPELVV